MKIFSAVMNPIAHDGRVHRALSALSICADVELVCPHGPPVPHDLPYRVYAVDLPDGFGARFLEHLVFWWHLVRHAMRMRPDVVYVHDHYPVLAGLLASKLTKATLVYDAHELAIPGANAKYAWQDRAKYVFDKIGMRKAAIVVTTSVERARIMQEHYGLARLPKVVRNIAEDSAMTLQRRRSPNRRKRIFVYQGHVTLDRGIDKYVRAMPYLSLSCQLLVVGGGPHVDDLHRLSASLGLGKRVSFTGRVSRDEVSAILCRCDVGLISYPWLGLNNLYCSPNKVFEYAQAGIPMVSTAQPALSELVADNGIGMVFEKDATDQVVAEIMMDVGQRISDFAPALARFTAENRWEAEAIRLREAFAGLSLREE